MKKKKCYLILEQQENGLWKNLKASDFLKMMNEEEKDEEQKVRESLYGGIEVKDIPL